MTKTYTIYTYDTWASSPDEEHTELVGYDRVEANSPGEALDKVYVEDKFYTYGIEEEKIRGRKN